MRVLVVEDNDEARSTLADLLTAEGYEVSTARGGRQALEEAEKHPPDLIVSDVCMPEGGGFDLVSEVRSRSWGKTPPILLMSAMHATSDRVMGLDLGADDYLPKPLDFDELLARLRTHGRRLQREVELTRESTLDPLTGVLNRRGLTEAYQRQCARARRAGTQISVAVIDLNDFKQVNDQHGHAVGDLALRAVATALQSVLRGGDVAGRTGGDEFVLVLEQSGPADAEAMLARFSGLSPVRVQAPGVGELQVGFAIGIAGAMRTESLEELVGRADQAMYRHKTSLRPGSASTE